MKTRWQKIIDILARSMIDPAVLSLEVHEKEITVFPASMTPDNSYNAGSSGGMLPGLYCETVMGKDSPVYLANASDNAFSETILMFSRE